MTLCQLVGRKVDEFSGIRGGGRRKGLLKFFGLTEP